MKPIPLPSEPTELPKSPLTKEQLYRRLLSLTRKWRGSAVLLKHHSAHEVARVYDDCRLDLEAMMEDPYGEQLVD